MSSEKTTPEEALRYLQDQYMDALDIDDGEECLKIVRSALKATAELSQERDTWKRQALREDQEDSAELVAITAERDELRRKLWDWNGQFETQEARLEAITAERDRLRKLLSSSPKIHLVWKTFPDGTEDIDSAIRQKDIFTSVKAEPGYREEVVFAVRVEGVG